MYKIPSSKRPGHSCAWGWPALAALVLAACTNGCGAGPDAGADAASRKCLTQAELPSTSLTGTWSGTVTLRQTLAGQTGQVDWPIMLQLGGNGYPQRNLAALGLVGDWQAYGSPPCSSPLDLHSLFGAGGSGTAYAYYLFEADGPANPIEVRTTLLAVDAESLRWSYNTSYRVADLLHYSLYDYTLPSAPQVQVTASEVYAVSGTQLVMQAEASGQDDKGQPVGILLTGNLTR